MKVIVTGGAGFIGSHIVDALLERGDVPVVIDNLESGSRRNLPAGVPLYEADIRDQDQVRRIFDEVRPEGVCHQAAQISVSRSMREPIFDAEVNVLGLLNIFENASRVGVKRVVFASSGGVLYGDVTSPASEDFPKKPKSAYGISKWVGEQYLEFYAKERNLQGVALRYSNVYGPRQNPEGEAGVTAIFIRRTLDGKGITINGDGKYIRDFVYGPDVARANVAALHTDLAEDFAAINIGTGLGVDINELAQMIADCHLDDLKNQGQVGRTIEIQHGPPRIGDLRSSLVSPVLAERLLGWKPTVSLKEGLRETVRWFGKRPSEL
ncbi:MULTISPECIES: NAD-dependent epimerase/dehydratase family protein [unclassified Schlesneria]|uniref:NAD-dependent epimerase/dehydratase family protein n=1 Tax=unclassified Schlesneria TaxID=2762017 RepID=UPI002EE9936B